MVLSVRVLGGGSVGTKSSLRIGRREDGWFVYSEGGVEEGACEVGRSWIITSGTAASNRRDTIVCAYGGRK